ncbi:MAG: IgA Peptidase M64 [Ignavibacteriaceae bacterium]|nr:IgA Peptidase M64 [Ignavibacteriaceae bacterium]
MKNKFRNRTQIVRIKQIITDFYTFKSLKSVLYLFLILFSTASFAQIKFDDYFYNKTLRLDYYHTGNHEEDFYSFDELIEEPFWAGSKVNLIDKFNFGNYKFVVVDEASGNPIYSRTYSTLFAEWQTVDEAKETYKSFSETVVFPFPKNNVIVEFYGRDRQNNLVKIFEYKIDSSNYFIKKERPMKYETIQVLYNGDPANKVDVAFIPEGYTQEEMERFKEDCQKFAGYFFNASPFKENKNNFNIWAVLAPSKESGTDIPADNIWKNTLLNSNFYTFDLERYLMTSDNKTLRHVASNVPYDQIFIIVNSGKYGGGAIYNHYSVCVNNNIHEEYVFTHEFGHGFAFLADEYYTSDVAYNDFYDLSVEPLERNITTLVDFESKWKNMVNKETPIPTPAIKEYKDKVGAFEGGGYVAKGVYRPRQNCSMKSISIDNFCPVCKQTIQDMIDFYIK